MPLARIGIGSNVGDATANVLRTLDELAGLGTVVARSSLYATEPWGVRDQRDFVNAALLLETALTPRELLAALKGLEGKLGRVVTVRWGPRVIDLDLLAYDDLELREPGLTIPHERLAERAFALAPLAEIDPAFQTAYEALPPDAKEGVRRMSQSEGG